MSSSEDHSFDKYELLRTGVPRLPNDSAAVRKDVKQRTQSQVNSFVGSSDPVAGQDSLHRRRLSADTVDQQSRLLLIPVDETLDELLATEDSNKHFQITIEDTGPKVLTVGTLGSEGFRKVDIRGTYVLASLLQELTLAKDSGKKEIIIEESLLHENPVDRINRFIRDIFWPNLTRCIDGANIEMVAKDSKDWTADPRPRVYVPPRATDQLEYYRRIAKEHPEIRLDVQVLNEKITPECIRDLNAAPGLLAIAMDKYIDKHGQAQLKGKPFIVPGGRFNELYGWDSYMTSLGLLLHDRVDLCKSMVENFTFCIEHYGKILNANRTYYLGRSQPPFLTDMTLRVYDRIKQESGAKDFLRGGILAAIKEYHTIWMGNPRLDPKSGLSRYRPEGIGVPPETEASHFLHVLTPYAEKHGISFEEFVHKYNTQEIKEPELDVYFLHDRAVRESGHDTTYRLEKVAADTATVDLNSCLYKIECDIARVIHHEFGGQLSVPPEFQAFGAKETVVETAAAWDRRAKKRRLAMDKHMWDEEAGMYFDYNTVKEKVTGYESATTFWALWAGVATPRQAAAMVIKALPKFEELGGLASGTEKSRGKVDLHRPSRQWDYPYGWAPQQILAWTGLERYGFSEEAQRLAYKWLYMCIKAFVDFNGIVTEKYDVTRPKDAWRVTAEYGNQGADVRGIPREGFGWVNSSIVLGLDLVNTHMRRSLALLTPWEVFEEATKDLSVDGYGLEMMEMKRLGESRSIVGHEAFTSGQAIHQKSPDHLERSHAGGANASPQH
ncbi:MAG: hypothetical protein Q9162_004899 [Coniocarpon cinnabarinum]